MSGHKLPFSSSRVVVPPYAVSKLRFFLSREFTHPGHSSCFGLLGHKYHIPTLAWLVKCGIPFKVVILIIHAITLVVKAPIALLLFLIFLLYFFQGHSEKKTGCYCCSQCCSFWVSCEFSHHLCILRVLWFPFFI